jgi:hypothetical protein
MRTDGIHFGTGEDFESGIWELLQRNPDAATLLNEPEARHHWSRARDRHPDGLVLWRSSPSTTPAQHDWNAESFSHAVFESIDFHHDNTGVYPTDILLLNELNLDYERGEPHNDNGAFDTTPANWPDLYGKIATFLDELLDQCKQRAADRGFSPMWWYQGWAPGHGEMRQDIADIWVPGAQKYDGIVLHAYTTSEMIEETVRWYAQTFPNHPLVLGEWNTINHPGGLGERVLEEARIRTRLRELEREIPRLHACYFIYAWASDESHQHDIKDNDARRAVWNGGVEIPEPGVLV